MRFLLCATTAVRSALQQISPTPTRQITYTYDDLNQLKTVTRNGITTEYNYQNGNITSVMQNGTAVKTYGYTDSTWGDLLTSFNGQTITYDEIGNPLQYRDGMSFTWAKGRQLQGITKDGLNASYTYDENGLRISKTVNGVTTKIFRTNGQMVGMNMSDGKDMTFILDGDGNVYGVHYDHYSASGLRSETYYFAYNAQGDVIGIYDFSGRLMAAYDYDEWGNCTVNVLAADSNGHAIDSPDHIAHVNPFRYRGYFYDAETGFYYLNSRYYDPGTGRFVNADGAIGANQDIHAYNLFAYCSNNPVNFCDPTGESILGALGATLGALAPWFIAVVAIAIVGTIAITVVGTPAINDGVATGIGNAIGAINNAIDNVKERVKEKTRAKEATTAIPRDKKPKEPVVFPVNPYDFHPLGLEMQVRVDIGNGKNGGIIHWTLPNTNIAIFEWDEDYLCGPHYHVMLPSWKGEHISDKHGYKHEYKAGDNVPEPWKSIYFK